MYRHKLSSLAAALSITALTISASADAATWDLKSDWSDASNPNGPPD